MKAMLSIFVSTMASVGLCAILKAVEPQFMASYGPFIAFCGGVIFSLLINLIVELNGN